MSSIFDNSAHFTVREAIQQASLFLNTYGVEDSRLQAEVLLTHVMRWDKAKLFTEYQTVWRSLPDWDKRQMEFENLLIKRANREPLQYLVGGQEFYGRWFHVEPGVLIPRPETETVVETCLEYIHQLFPRSGSVVKAVDVGTGSGAIAATLKLERPDLQVYAIDLSDQALDIAKRNADEWNADIRFLKGDLLEPLLQHNIAPVQVVISNPPYIPSEDIGGLQPEVRDFEPVLALDGGADGMDPYRRIIKRLPSVLSGDSPRAVVFEVGISQADAIARMLTEIRLFEQVEVTPDLAGIPRVVAGIARK